MTLKELAEYFRVSPAKLAPYLTMRGKKRIVAKKIGRKWEISHQSAHAWLLAIYEEEVLGGSQTPRTNNNEKATIRPVHPKESRRKRRPGTH